MVQIIEAGRIYIIPIEETDPNWVQTQEIPVTYSELRINPSTFVYLRFPLSTQPSPLDIVAGDSGNVEIAGRRIRAQMIHKLERALAALQTPTPYPVASLEVEQIGQYFSPRI